jgi:hypothetical protein
MKCSVCGSERLRLSRLRLSDLRRLLLFSYPIRCALCGKRTFVNSSAAIGIHRNAIARKRAFRDGRTSAHQGKGNGA